MKDVKKNPYAGTKTKKNLLDVFARESQARNKYPRLRRRCSRNRRIYNAANAQRHYPRSYLPLHIPSCQKAPMVH